jgi:hypothetical protein
VIVCSELSVELLQLKSALVEAGELGGPLLLAFSNCLLEIISNVFELQEQLVLLLLPLLIFAIIVAFFKVGFIRLSAFIGADSPHLLSHTVRALPQPLNKIFKLSHLLLHDLPVSVSPAKKRPKNK